MKTKKKKNYSSMMYALGGEKNPKAATTTYQTQAEVDAANMQAKRLAKAYGLMTADEAYVARNIGDPVVSYVNPNGTPYVSSPTMAKATRIPAGVDLQGVGGAFYYTDPHTGDEIDVADTVASFPRFKNSIKGGAVNPENPLGNDNSNKIHGLTLEEMQGNLMKNKPFMDLWNKNNSKSFAMGGQAGMMNLAKSAPGILNAVMALIEGGNDYSQEPIINPATMRSMVSPYSSGRSGTFAFGGEYDDMNMDQGQEQGQGVDLSQLQAMADEQGVSIEELVQMIQEQQQQQEADTEAAGMIEPEDTGAQAEEGDYKYGGIHIKKKNRGKFTASAKKAGMGVQAYAKKVLASPSASPTLKKRANFARNAAKWKHAYGGMAKNSGIEVEDDEVLETPNGSVRKMSGATHEQGGIDVNVPDGTKIYSDRIEIDGKTMAERKLAREKKAARLSKLREKNPLDKLLKGTIERTIETLGFEEDKDMKIMKVASATHKLPQSNVHDDNSRSGSYAWGGVKRTYAGGGQSGDYLDYQDLIDPKDRIFAQFPALAPKDFTTGILPMEQVTMKHIGQPAKPAIDNYMTPLLDYNVGRLPMEQVKGDPAYAAGSYSSRDFSSGTTGLPISGTPSVGGGGYFADAEAKAPLLPGALTAGDLIGIGGNAFNAIAPLLNTNSMAANMKPNVNRFRGFGKDAIDANEKAQDVIAGLRTGALTDIDTASNTSRLRSRNSATSVNTIRALDTATDLGTNKAKVSVSDNFAKQMAGLLGQKAQLENQQDLRVMSGEAARDIEDKADIDNYYSNRAQNLVNFGTNVQGIGRNLNVSKSNKVNANLISQLSQYGLGFDDEGNLINMRK